MKSKKQILCKNRRYHGSQNRAFSLVDDAVGNLLQNLEFLEADTVISKTATMHMPTAISCVVTLVSRPGIEATVWLMLYRGLFLGRQVSKGS